VTPSGLGYSRGRVGRSGERRAPPLLVFAHGAGFNRGCWYPALSELHARCWERGRAFDVVAFDWTAHGRSRPLPTKGAPAADRYVWRDVFPSDVATVLADLDAGARPVYGFGHSMGGAGLTLAELAAPGTFRGLCLLEPILAEPVEDKDQALTAQAAHRRARFADCDDRAGVVAYFKEVGCRGWRPDAVEAYVEYGVAPAADGVLALSCTPDAEASVYMAVSQSFRDTFPRLGEVACPTIVVAGRESESLSHLTGAKMATSLRPVAAAFAKPLAAALALPTKDTTFEMVKDGAHLTVHACGHDVMMECPEWTAAFVVAAYEDLSARR